MHHLSSTSHLSIHCAVLLSCSLLCFIHCVSLYEDRQCTSGSRGKFSDPSTARDAMGRASLRLVSRLESEPLHNLGGVPAYSRVTALAMRHHRCALLLRCDGNRALTFHANAIPAAPDASDASYARFAQCERAVEDMQLMVWSLRVRQ